MIRGIELSYSIEKCWQNLAFARIVCKNYTSARLLVLVDFLATACMLGFSIKCARFPYAWPGGGGVLPYERLLGMCRWMGSHFHDWIDYNGATLLVELLEWGRTFSGFLG